ncbi:MAG TPA: peroxiredoxin [Cytophagales bacterium]|nr:peroxiredoxin [Cytophagales bacterium]
MSLVGKKAPIFTAAAVVNGQVVENFSLTEYLGKKDVIFFFYPFDFTFVCPTEILEFQRKLKEFESRNVAVVGCSIDSEFSHLAWVNTPRNKGGIEGVTYPLVADTSKSISSNYGVLAGEYGYNEEGEMEFNGTPAAYRGTFLIDKKGIVRHCVINDLPLGRNIDEAIRIVDALHHHEEHGEVCPANWNKGDEAMQATSSGVAEYLTKH